MSNRQKKGGRRGKLAQTRRVPGTGKDVRQDDELGRPVVERVQVPGIAIRPTPAS